MSASNWTRCPICKVRDAEKAAKMYAEATASYGKASPEEYIQSLKRAQEFAAENPEEMLREDYEQGIDEDGEYSVSYRAGCDVCGFTFSYKHSEQAASLESSGPPQQMEDRKD